MYNLLPLLLSTQPRIESVRVLHILPSTTKVFSQYQLFMLAQIGNYLLATERSLSN